MMMSLMETCTRVQLASPELAPNEDHGRAGSDTKENHSGDVLFGVFRRDETGEDMVEKEHTEGRHTERLDQPVDDQGYTEPLRLLGYVFERAEIHVHHHGVDHDPDEDRHHQIHTGVFETGHELEKVRSQSSQTEAA